MWFFFFSESVDGRRHGEPEEEVVDGVEATGEPVVKM